jgi:hypothetical protein
LDTFQLPIKDIQHVNEGELLFVVDSRPYKLALDATQTQRRRLEDHGHYRNDDDCHDCPGVVPCLGSALAAPSTAYIHGWNMLPIGQQLWRMWFEAIKEVPTFASRRATT